MTRTNILILIFLIISSDYLQSEYLDINIAKEGMIENEFTIINSTIKDDEELRRIREITKDGNLGSDVDFDKELLLFIGARDRNAVDIGIDRMERGQGDQLDVVYSVKELSGLQIGKLGIDRYPYLIARINRSGVNVNKVIFSENYKIPPVPADTALAEDTKYTNILTTYQDLEILDYIPLDAGSLWSYKIEENSNKVDVTQQVKSVSNGWSIFNSYFGRRAVGMKIDPAGNLLITSEGKGPRSFYNESVTKSFISKEIETPAGKFNDLMVVTVPDNGKFWFKDVYAKNVGLVLHEHRSDKGVVKYMLTHANVRGKSYPQ